MEGRVVRVTFFKGFGWLSSVVERLLERVVEDARDCGLRVVVERVTVPALDEEGYTPSVLVDGVEVPIVLNDAAMLNMVVEEAEKRLGLLAPDLVEWAGFPVPVTV
ncbi:MAG: hypothetical protein GXO09_01735 [Crenarchaeota archaeon]|nr:hypothetical protein [Thermoproteota archaeon]